MDEDETALEWGGVRIDLAHVDPSTREPMIREARAWMAQGQRPPILTITDDGLDVSERPDLWPLRVRTYRGLGRYEWVGTRQTPAKPPTSA
ncbi:hypothetical protein [Amnibacterium kyonggiense]|uniref:Uncharacterized protein n=1 Tax=Amnibacterium kyonggiense TaxID=595671 RepID=A0A4R7FG59_9MICO|nr:hypothetical protein [Amnibacterium kyonggiense]TDS75910.1 hypothetical protein CLV52_3021 [Amnibacterium kyonggiense]